METNIAKDKRIIICFMLRKGSADVVKLDEWLRAKNDLLGWSLILKNNATCEVKTC